MLPGTLIESSPATPPGPPVDLRAALKGLFGFDDFRPGQEAVIRAVMEGRDTLALMPTGAGKSLCYQLPAMLLPGVTLVISPLIALMKDQHEGLPPAVYEQSTFINSSLDGAEMDRRMMAVLTGQVRLVYAAPERLRQQPFVHALRRAEVGLVVVDEAHCVSLWGHDFRPDYLFIGRSLPALGNPRVLGMTATATPQVAHEIGTQLGRAMHLVHTSPFRPNLFYQVRYLANTKEKTRALVEFCRGQGKVAGIVYVRSRRSAEELADELRRAGVNAGHYHAGMEPGERSQAQENWMLDKTRVIVATIAFGMGIDKSNVRYIVHYSPPDSLESYAQESGRAGRDGRPAICLMLATPGDRANLSRWLRESQVDKERLRRVYGALRRQVPANGPARLVNLADLERDANEGQAERLGDTELRVGIGLMERAGLMLRHADAPTSATVRLEGTLLSPLAPDLPFEQFVETTRLRPGQTGDVFVPEVAGQLGWNPAALEMHLLQWQDAGRLRFRAGNREAVIERLPAPPDAAERMDSLLGQYDTAQQTRLTELFGYATTQECRHVVIAAHLGHTIAPCGSGCDNCASGAAEQAQRSTVATRGVQLEPLLARARTANASFAGTHLNSKVVAKILGVVAELPYPVNKTALGKVLVGQPDAPFTPSQVPSSGTLGGAYRKDVSRLIDDLVDLGYLQADNHMGARVILLGDPAHIRPEPVARARSRPDDDEGASGPSLVRRWGQPAPDSDEGGPADEIEGPDLPANPAQVMIECIASLPFPLGKTGVAQVLAGSATAKVEADRCKHWGALAMCTQDAIVGGLETLLAEDWLQAIPLESSRFRPSTPGAAAPSVLALTAGARLTTPLATLVQLVIKPSLDPARRLRRQERERQRTAAQDEAARLVAARAARPTAETLGEVDEDVAADRFERLRAWRRVAASKAGIPPYMIFHDKALWVMARTAITSTAELLTVPGVGRATAEKYSSELLAILADE